MLFFLLNQLLNKPLHNRTVDSRRYTTGSLHKPAYRKTKHHDQERRKDEPLPVREVKETGNIDEYHAFNINVFVNISQFRVGF